MKYLSSLTLALLMSSYLFAQASALREPLSALSTDLESRYNGRQGVKVALLEFRTTDDRLLPFNEFIRDEFVLNYQNSKAFKLIDPLMSARLATENGWSMKTVSSFPYYEKLGRQFMERTAYVPDIYLYGQIQDNEESITVTAYMVFTGSTDAKVIAAVSFPSDEQTDRLLKKPIKKRPKPLPKTDTVVVIKQIEVQSKPDTVYVERVVKEVSEPVEIVSAPPSSLPSADYENFHFQLTEVSFNGEKLHIRFTVENRSELESMFYLTVNPTRIIDQDGNEYLHPEAKLGSATSTYSVNKKLAAGIPMKGELVFSNVPKKALIKLLEIGVQDEKISFRDLPVQK